MVLVTHEVTAQPAASVLRVGMPRTFFHDVPPVLVKIATDPFATVIRNATGTTGELIVGTDALAVARDLGDRKLQLAVFHSFEYGWVREKFPELRPLMLAVNSQRSVSAYILVRRDSELVTFADLKGKDLSLPRRSREPTRQYVERRCISDGVCGSKDFFGHIVSPPNVEVALDELCQGKVPAVAVDAIGLEFYKDLKPGCFKRLKVLAESGPFPPAVVVHWKGALDNKTLALLTDCLQNAHSTPLGAEMMKMWKITSFDPVPANYNAAVAACIKRYPCPEPRN
jgi:ABC-type phosphate/phosphonate transport system substrate-binding protein